MLRTYLALALLAAGCSSTSPPGAAATRCAEPMGAYQVCFRLVDGNCAVPPCASVTLPEPPDPACVNRGKDAADKCSAVVDITCTATDNAGATSTTSLTGDLMANDTIGRSYTSHVLVTSTAGAAQCSGHFRLEYMRQ